MFPPRKPEKGFIYMLYYTALYFPPPAIMYLRYPKSQCKEPDKNVSRDHDICSTPHLWIVLTHLYGCRTTSGVLGVGGGG